MWSTDDPDGRPVTLAFARWRHIARRHPEIARDRSVVLVAISDPEERLPGRIESEEWYYARSPRLGRWIKVVVHYDEGRGLIVTAFPRRWIP